MKFFLTLIFLFFFHNCSFDDKSGIWENKNKVSDKNKLFKDFESLSTKDSIFNKEILFKKNSQLKLENPIFNLDWKDIYYDETNNLKNFSFKGVNQVLYKSKKVTKSSANEFMLYENENIILTDQKGTITVFSSNNKKIVNKFNFYKNRFKKIKKYLNIIVDKNIIYVSDNLGYLYAYNYKKSKIIWAKNYKTPFRSNLKLSKDQLILANQNNGLLFINRSNGEIIKLIPTEETKIQNKFKNNLSINKDTVLFLNTYGSLYSINLKDMRINWFLNLNQTFDLNPSNLFFGSQLVSFDDKISVSSNNFTYIIDSNTGSILYKINFSSKIRPLMIKNHLIAITKNNFLIIVDTKSNNVIYSTDISKKILKYLKLKKTKINSQSIFIANNYIYIVLENSQLIKLNLRGNLEKIVKLPNTINSQPLFVNDLMIYLNKSGRLVFLY